MSSEFYFIFSHFRFIFGRTCYGTTILYFYFCTSIIFSSKSSLSLKDSKKNSILAKKLKSLINNFDSFDVSKN